MWQWLGFRADPDWTKARWLGRALGVALGLLALVLVLLTVGLLAQMGRYVLIWPADPAASTAHEAIRNIGLILVALFGAPFVVWRSVVAQKQADTAEQSHITDQINKAVEALGAEKTVSRIGRVISLKTPDGPDNRIEWQGQPLVFEGNETFERIGEWQAIEETVQNTEVRIGGIYALERIAQDSVERDHVPIMEILTAYIRENAPVRGLHFSLPPSGASPADTSQGETDRGPAEQIAEEARNPLTDAAVQAAIRVIARRNEHQKTQEASDPRYGKLGYAPDLRGTNLRGVDVSSLDLSRSNLVGAHLGAAVLRRTLLQRAGLVGAHLEGAMLAGAQLQGSDLRGACLTEANLIGVQVDGATRFIPAKLNGAALKQVDLSAIKLDRREAEHLSACLASAYGDGTVQLPCGVRWPEHWPDWHLPLFGEGVTFYAEFKKWQDNPEVYEPPAPPAHTDAIPT